MLVDDDNKDITAYDTRGEVCVRGNTIIKGYYKNQKATEESWDSEGFFHTGDILYCDGKSKKWYCVDRKKGKSYQTSSSAHRKLTGRQNLSKFVDSRLLHQS